VSTSRQVPVTNWVAGEYSGRDDRIAGEVPVALTYNRLSHVVMMATPSDLEDFALGFSLTEGIIDDAADLLATQVIPRDNGIEVAMQVTERCFARLATQRRNLTGRTGCGLCGSESLDQALRYPPPVGVTIEIPSSAIQRAIAAIPGQQPLQSVTGAVHCAAWCSLPGEVLELREDVGRHNALDKLIGALSRRGFSPRDGFLVVSSRASYEMVFKAAAAGMELLAAVSAPTTLAVDFALRSGLTLVGFARPGRHNVYSFPERIRDSDGNE
jgi:FdhD protein